MDSISLSRNPNLHHLSFLSFNPNPNPNANPNRSFFNPQIPAKPQTLTPIRAASQNPNPVTAILKTSIAGAVAGAALFLSRHSHAAPPPPQTQSETETLTLKDEVNEQTLEYQLESNPNDVSALRALMELKVKLGKLPEAIAVAERLIEVEPEDEDVPLLKAHLQSYSGDFEAAKSGFESILLKNPYLVEAYHGLVMIASQSGQDGEVSEIMKRVENAMEMCKKEKRKEELRDFKMLVAQVEVMEGKYLDALKVYQELVKEEPRDFRPYLCQGIIYTLMRKKDEAEKQFKKYRRLVPKGHPYGQFFDHNMNAMKGMSSMK